ncbi:MAG: glycosyltransferase, partial [Bacteroidota bacterium]
MGEYDIILYTLFPTDNVYSSVSLSMAKEFAKNNRVFYVNKPYSVKDFVGNLNNRKVRERAPKLLTNQIQYETLEKIPQNFVAATPPLSLPINWLPVGKTYDYLHGYNRSLVLRTVDKFIKDYRIKKFIYLNCYNPYGAAVLPKAYGSALNVYQSIDDISQNDYTVKHGLSLENEAIKRADITLVTSKELWNLKSQISPNTHILNNAVDNSVFKRTLTESFLKPKELEGRTGNVVGFIGNLDELRVNYPLIKKAALAHSNKTFLLVGPLNNTENLELGLPDIPNIIFAGGKNLYELPRYLQYMDCCLIPFLCNTLTKSIYPLKINEYLTAGKPVIATNFSEDIQSFKKHIYLANSEDEFVQLIDKALEPQGDGVIKDRIALAESNTWTARINQFWNI